MMTSFCADHVMAIPLGASRLRTRGNGSTRMNSVGYVRRDVQTEAALTRQGLL